LVHDGKMSVLNVIRRCVQLDRWWLATFAT